MAHSESDLNTLSIYVPQSKLKHRPIERLSDLAEKRDRSINYLAVEAILEYLRNEESDEEPDRVAMTVPTAAPVSETRESPIVAGDPDESEPFEIPADQRDDSLGKGSGPLKATILERLRGWCARLWQALTANRSRQTSRAREEQVECTGDDSAELAIRAIVHKAERIKHSIRTDEKILQQSDYLAPYREASLPALPDPREGYREAIRNAIEQIVSIEGPVTLARVEHLCAESAGLRRVGRVLRKHYGDAAKRAIKEGTVKSVRYHIASGWSQVVLYHPDTSPISPRVIGPRSDLYQIPIPELGMFLIQTRKALTRGGTISLSLAGLTDEGLHRLILKSYGLTRLTKKAQTYFVAAVEARFPEDMHIYELREEERA